MLKANKFGRLRMAALALVVGLASFRGPAQVITEEDLSDDPNLSRQERIRRHKLRLQKLVTQYQTEAAERQQQRETEGLTALEAQRQQLEAAARTGTAPPQRMAPRPTTAQRIARPTGRPSGATLSTQGAVAFRVSRAIVYISPFQALSRVGDSLNTEVRLSNRSNLPFDEIALHLEYDPLVVAPETVNDAAIYDFLADAPELRVNSSKGELHYSARLRESLTITTATLLAIRWRALNPILYSEITFGPGEKGTRIGEGKGNILGFVAGGVHSAGTLPAAVVISPRSDSPRSLMPPFSEIAIAGIDERVRLRLESESESVAQDQEWIVSLALDNDAALPFNNLCLRILFDPAKLQVVDWHQGNWIRQGINIYDGFAHETYPFEVHRANLVDNKQGEILYHVGSRAARFFPSGELARIKFTALADASLADVFFDFEDPQRADETVVTDVDFLGSSVLFASQRRAVQSAQRPAPEPLRRPDT